MGKGKMTLMDVRAMVKELRAKLLGHRLSNVYNLSSKQFLFKFNVPGEGKKLFMLMESGARAHTTEYEREKDKLPSNFCLKLRKHVRTKRLEKVNQLGIDRVIDFQFGAGDTAFHILLELYASGNLILTDHKYEILVLLRIHEYKDDSNSKGGGGGDNNTSNDDTGSQRVAVRNTYPMNFTQPPAETMTAAQVAQLLQEEQKEEAERLAAQPAQEQEQAEAAAAAAAVAASLPTGPGKAAARKRREAEREAKEAAKANASGGGSKRKARKKARQQTIKQALTQCLHYGPQLVEHALLRTGLEPSTKLADVDGAKWADKLAEAFANVDEILERLATDNDMPGYLVSVAANPAPESNVGSDKPKLTKAQRKAKRQAEAKAKLEQQEQQQQQQQESAEPTKQKDDNIANEQAVAAAAATATPAAEGQEAKDEAAAKPKPAEPTQDESEKGVEKKPDDAQVVMIHKEFFPILLEQHKRKIGEYAKPGLVIKEVPSLDKAMDEYFAHAESQREEVRLLKDKAAAWRKVERVKEHHKSQVEALEAQATSAEQMAGLIEGNFDAVEKAISTVNVEVARGTDWRELSQLVKDETANGNLVASIIHSLDLKNDAITLLLSPGMAHCYMSKQELREEPEMRPVKVRVQLGLSAFSNAETYYTKRKKTQVKQEKTQSMSEKAIKAAAKKTVSALKEVDAKARIQRIRKVHWFEKYHWFITSENFLVVGGKSAQENELLVKRHLGANDIYIHADVHGASSVIVKNHTDKDIPPLSLSQAGVMTLCRSSAWKEKIVTSSYWVRASQVSKTPPSGLNLPTGSFMIYGKKNYLPREPLVMGLGLLWRVDESCIAHHIGERRPRNNDDDDAAAGVRKGLDKLKLSSKDTPSQPKQKAARKEKKRSHKAGKHKSAATNPADGNDDDDDADDDDKPQMQAEEEEEEEEEETKVEDDDDDDDDDMDFSSPGFDITSQFVRQSSLVSQASSTLALDRDGDHSEGEAGNSDADQNDDDNDDAGGNGESGQASAKSSSGKKKVRLTARQRRQMKRLEKYAAMGKEAPASVKPQASKKAEQAAEQVKRLPRGKRTKVKRAKQKYALQDENDRRMAAELYGVQGLVEDKGPDNDKDSGNTKSNDTNANAEADGSSNSKSDAAAAAAAAAADAAGDDVSKQCFHCKEVGHLFKNCPKRAKEQAAEGVSFSQARKLAQTEENAEIRQIMAEENIKEAGPATLAGELDAFTGQPRADDVLRYALPMCAPIAVLKDFKFKVKLVPGPQKKGKATQAAMNYFSYGAQPTAQEKDLIRGVADTEVISVLLSGVKVSAPGAQLGKGKGKGGKGKGKKKGGGGGKKQKQKQGKGKKKK